MKRFLIAATLIFATHAYATDVAYTENARGGNIVLTDLDGNCLIGHVFYSTNTKGDVITRGCYVFNDPSVDAVSDGGTTASWPIDEFTVTKKGARKYGVGTGT